MLGRQRQQGKLTDLELWVGREVVPPDSFYGRFAAVADRLVQDEEFARCYRKGGRPSVSPALLTKVLLLALRDGCSDRRAVEMMRWHAGWKAVLRLAWDEMGCHPTTLVVFRARLLMQELDRELFLKVVRRAVEARLLSKDAVQTIDSSAILGAGAVQDTYTLLRKALRRVLRAAGPRVWLVLKERAALYEQDEKAAIDWDDASARREELGRLAADARAVLEAVGEQDQAEDSQVQLARELLQQVVQQDVETGADGRPQLRQSVARGRVPSTTDPQMRHGRKSAERKWTGYKQHVMSDPQSGLVTAVGVTPASEGDGSQLEPLLEQQREVGLAPQQVVGDQAYGGGAVREKMAQQGVEVVAKVAPISNGACFSKDRFDIDLEAQTVRCPAGQTVELRHAPQPGHAQHVRFPDEVCRACPLRSQCVRGQGGRHISIAAYEARRQLARVAQRQPETQRLLKLRPAAERTLAHLVRWGSRKARYLGTRKVGFQLFLVGLLANLTRLSQLSSTDPSILPRLLVGA